MTSLTVTALLSTVATIAQLCLLASVSIYIVRRQNIGHNRLCFPFECVHSLLSLKSGGEEVGWSNRDRGRGGALSEGGCQLMLTNTHKSPSDPHFTLTKGASLCEYFIFQCVQY